MLFYGISLIMKEKSNASALMAFLKDFSIEVGWAYKHVGLCFRKQSTALAPANAPPNIFLIDGVATYNANCPFPLWRGKGRCIVAHFAC